MSDDPEELSHRLDRIEQLLRRPSELPSRVPAGPEVRSARSIVSRVDDVWVAVTEGNERLIDAIERLRTDIAEFASAVAALAGVGDPADGGAGVDQGTGGATWSRGGEGAVGPPVANPATGTPDASEPAVHLRLNRIEEALAGIAGRLDEPAGAVDTATTLVRVDESLAGIAGRLDDLVSAFVHPPGSQEAPAGVRAPSPADALIARLNAEVHRVGQRLGSLTLALAAAGGGSPETTAPEPSSAPVVGSTVDGAGLRLLERVVPAAPGRPGLADDRRPIREVTRQVAFEPDGWSPDRAARISALFDGLAPGWHERPGAGRYEAVDDALARGGPFPAGPCLEVGSGTGLVSARLAPRFSPLVTIDLSPGMLALAPPTNLRVQADASSLPVPDGAAAVVVLVNMFLFPAEVDRVLAGDGVLVWVNTMGDATPIHLPAEDVVAALPGDWEGMAADAGWGTWASLRRAPTA